MSKYTSEFTSINNIDYRVDIVTESGNSTTNFKLGGNPFVTSMDSDGKTMFAPIKSTGATVEMLVKDTLPLDIYSVNNQGTKVTLTNTTTNTVEWVGYVTPSSYSQDYNNETETLQIDCVDGIASLKECPYMSIENKETFLNIIFKILKVCNCYKNLYVVDSVRLTSSDTTNILSKLRISEGVFFDDMEYEAQPIEDIAMSCYDVLYEIMQYMCYTMVSHGENVYILDYDAIRNNNNTFFKYSLTNTTIGSPTTATLSQRHAISQSSFAESGTDFSLSEVFNQCTVEDDFKDSESAILGIDESRNIENITDTTDTKLINWYSTDIRYAEAEVFTIKDETFFAAVIFDYDEYPKKTIHNRYFVVGKFYKHALIETVHYNTNNILMSESSYNPMCYSKLFDGKGATYIGYFTHKLDEDAYKEWKKNGGWSSDFNIWKRKSKEEKLVQFGKLCNISNLGNKKLVKYITCLNQHENHIEHDKVKNYRYFTIKKNISQTFGGKGGYIILHGTVIRHDMPKAPFPMHGTCWRHKDTNSTIYKNESYIWSRLKWGKYYWKCEGDCATVGDWTTTPSYFKIFYGDPTKEVDTNYFQDKDLKFYNNCGELWGVDEDGYYIPTPDDVNLEGTIEWSFYANKDTKGKYARNNAGDKKNSYNGHKPVVMFYKDLDITIGYSDDTLKDDTTNTDTIYSNDVSDYKKVCPMEDISFKICTFDNKTPSFYTVDYDVNGNSTYLDTTYSIPTKNTLRQEEHFILKNVSQYQEPRIVLNLNLKQSLNIKPWAMLTYSNFSDKYFIIDTMNIDYKYNKVDMGIIEKTNKYN